jgi:hypothetical protein
MVNLSTTDIMCTLVVELRLAAIGSFPFATLFTYVDATICTTVIDARAPLDM